VRGAEGRKIRAMLAGVDRNPRLSSMSGPLREAALETRRMRFDVPDAAPTDRMNRIVWGIVKAWGARADRVGAASA